MGFYVIMFFAIFFIPCLILARWRKRPLWAFLIAAFILFLIQIAPGIIGTIQAVMIYGAADPRLVAGGISETIVSAGLGLILYLPLLALFQWGVRYYYKRKAAKADK